MIDFSTLQGLTIPTMTRKVEVTNLVPAMSSLTFSLGSSSGSCEMSTAHTKYGSTSLCNTGVAGYNEMYAVSSQKFQLIPDHFYYACVEVYQESKLGSVDYFWPSGSPSIFGGQAAGNAGTWEKLSNVTTRTSFTAGEYPVRLDFNNGGTAGKAWYDGLMLIDLTEAFGAGNEPGNAWCQANIPYFTGTMSLGWEFRNLCPAISGAEGFTISGSSGTRSIEASTAHTKYAAQSLKMSLGSDCAEVSANSTGTYPLDASHIYYFRIEAYQEVKYGTMEMYFPIAEPKPFNIPAKEAGRWNIYSTVCGRSGFSSGNQRFRIDFNNGTPYQNAEVWYDGVMIVDLTAACGAGNEPSQEWCDANIPYFTGTTTILPLSSPIQAAVTQIADVNGRVLWVLPVTGEPIVLEVEKLYCDTYVDGTSRTENCILLDIYPMSANSIVDVTYGNLTKTLTFSGTEPQLVSFGTFGGVSDEVTTPDSGTLTIEGGCIGVGNGFFNRDKSTITTQYFITSVTAWGGIKIIPDSAFSSAEGIVDVILPSGVRSIGDSAFSRCFSLAHVYIPESVTSIGRHAFYDGNSVHAIESVEFGNTFGWYVTETEGGDASTGIEVDVSDPAANAIMIEDTYSDFYWYRS